jgi:3,4-dihydroxy-2-butanone 4-phosphate synthase
MSSFGSIEQAVADIAAGKAVVVVDDEDRENEGDLIFAAEKATTELLAFMIRHSSGVVCAPVTEADADRLELPPMYHTNQDRKGTAFTVSVDAREGVTTGISAAERAHTLRLLGAQSAGASDLSRPGHVSAPRTVVCCGARATPKPLSISRAWRGSTLPASCARSSTTTAPWRASRTWRSSPLSMG